MSGGYIKASQIDGLPAGSTIPSGTGFRKVVDGVEQTVAVMPTYQEVGADSNGAATYFLGGHEATYDHTKIHDGTAQDSAIAAKTTLSAVKADADVSDAITKKHANTLDHAHSNKTALDAVTGSNTGDQDISGKVDKSGSITQIITRNHSDLSGVGTNAHTAIDTFIASKAAASGLASLDANSKLAQAPTRANGAYVHANLANDTLAMAFATNSSVKVTFTAARTLTTTVPPAGCEAFLMILTNSASSWVITFGTGFKSTGTLATGTASAKVFVIHWISDGTNLYEAGRTAAMTA
jgi:hypothetical protein